MVKKFYLFFIALVFVIFDQFLKYFVSSRFLIGESVPVIGGLDITLTHNYGASFSLFQGYSGVFILLAIIAIWFVFYLYKEIPQTEYIIWMVGLFLAGALGNLIDRIRFGYVIDFIDFGFWPIFNVADIALFIGCFGLIYWFWKN